MTDFRKVLVLDDRLNVKDNLDFAVFKGASSKVNAIFGSVSASQSQVSFNIQVPSELTVIDREVILEATYTLNITGIPQAGKYLIDYGNGHALAPFPFHQMISTATATINNNSVSLNVQDVLEAINRFHDKRQLNRYNGMTPTAFDTYLNYADAVDTNNNPNGSFSNVADNDLYPRGAFPVSITGNNLGDGTTPSDITMVVQVREPLLISPFIFCDPSTENQGFYGIQNLNFIFNIGSLSNVLRGVNNSVALPGNAGYYNISLASITSNDQFKLYFNFLTAPNSVLLPPRNVVPYYELPRYKTSVPSSNQSFTSPALNQFTINSPSIQLNQVPDKLIVFVRKQTKTVVDSNSYLPINNISINFNNVSGLLSSSQANDLWKMSVKSGSNQSWLEFSGVAVKHTGAYAGAVQTVPTSGSMLILDYAKEIPLNEEYYAPSSLGQFQLQFNLSVSNNTGAQIEAGTYELVIITMNSGMFVAERGTAATYTAVLTKADVLDASQSESRMSYDDARRLVGGNLMSFVKKAAPVGMKVAKELLKSSSDKRAQTAANVLGALGFGKSGGGPSGGRMSSHLM